MDAIKMKAAVMQKYGKPENIQFLDIEKPKIAHNEVLVKMKAASINPVDWKIMKGELKPIIHFSFPMRLGSDGAGIIEEVGSAVNDFNVGDEVYFRTEVSHMGTFAEYINISSDLIAKKPSNMTFTEAASIPLVGLTSYQALSDRANIKSGNKVLIHAGSGGIGTFAIQYAKHIGAYVATTGSEKRFDLLKNLGADKLIDYKKEQFENELKDYDIVYDTIGADYHEKSYKVLAKDGKLVSILGIPTVDVLSKLGANWLIKTISRINLMFKNNQAKKHHATYLHHFMHGSGKELAAIGKIIEQGKIKAVIDSTYSLEKLKEAINNSVGGRAVGKIVVEIE